jgi:hypothetical protein
MESNYNENKKPVKLFYFNKLKKMRFNKFEIYLGLNKNTHYRYDDTSKDNYDEIVNLKDYEKLSLINNKLFNVDEILVDTEWESLNHLIQNINSSKQLFDKINKLMRYYIEDLLYSNENGSFELIDFEITYFIDGEIREIVDYNEKQRNLLYKFFIYSSIFFLISGFILFFVDELIGGIVFFIPSIIYSIWGVHKVLNEMRNGKNIFKFYLIDVPLFIVFKTIFLCWYYIPFHFIYKSKFYYGLLEFIGGVIGETIWIGIYIFLMTYLGSKLLDYLDSIEKKVKSFFNS